MNTLNKKTGFPLVTGEIIRKQESSVANYTQWHQNGFFSLPVFFITLLIILATSFDYIWLGALPAWLVVSLIGLSFGLIFSSSQRKAFSESLKVIRLPVLLPIIIFMMIALAIDFARGNLEESFSKRFLLNASVIVAMVSAATWGLMIKRSYIVNLFAIIVLAQGLVCVAQYLGSLEAWDLANKVAAVMGKIDPDEAPSVTFAQVHRVKGTNLFIHKFTPMQGMLVTFLTVVAVMNFQYKNPLRLKNLFIFIAIIIGLIGMALTFSRSVFLGFSISVMLVVFSMRNIKALAAIVMLTLGLFIAESYVNIESGKQFSRLTDTSMSRATNSSRLVHFKYAMSVFEDSPLVGAAPSKNNHVLVHSLPLRILVEYGIVGLMPYLLVLFGLYRKFKNGSGKDNVVELRVLSKASTYALLIAIIDGWTHSSGFLIRDITQGVLFGVFIGCVLPIKSSNINY